MTYRGLLLDFGGVLTTPVTDSFARFCEIEGIDVDAFRTLVLDIARTPDSLFALVERGQMEQQEFDRRLAAMLSQVAGRVVDPTDLKQRLFAASGPEDRMLDAVKRFRAAGVRTALVSNSWGGRDYPRSSFDDLFDGVVISGEVGMRKPDPEIYLLAAEKIGVEAGACVFVDDFKINVRGAEVVGMYGIHHRDSVETVAQLQRLFEVDLAAPA